MGYVNDEKLPELLYIIEDQDDEVEVQNIMRMVNNMNEALIDSGFENHKFVVDIDSNKAYVRKVS